jgi:beta-galactosidase
VFNQKVHIKGFQFKSQKAYDRHWLAENDGVYGDTFTVSGRALENIGNNVSVTYNGMDFYKGAAQVEIRWRSNRDNTVRLVFAGEGGDTVNLLALPAQAEYASARLRCENAPAGPGRLTFIFLPGSEIDIEWFQFFAGE